MDDLNEMARLHSAGATVRHTSPFDHLISLKNENELTADFIQRWVKPFYMEIGSLENEKWVKSIKEIKNEITTDVCISLLGDFNWRTRLVGTYFAAVRGYHELIDVIGTHLLKSEVCCVGHIYALTLAFFDTEKSVQYLHTYLNYYLTRPDLYFDQESVLIALLYLNKEGEAHYLKKHFDDWNRFTKERKHLSQQSAFRTAKLLEAQAGKDIADAYLKTMFTDQADKEVPFKLDYLDRQIVILKDLSHH